jgi:hypoxanthine phosphoribosyltransferase
LSIVAPATAGLPVAYAVCEALRAHQVYWAERENATEPLRFREYLEVNPGEQVLLVDDVLRTGKKLTELKKLVEARGGQVVGLAVMIYQPNPKCATSVRCRSTIWLSWTPPITRMRRAVSFVKGHSRGDGEHLAMRARRQVSRPDTRPGCVCR